MGYKILSAMVRMFSRLPFRVMYALADVLYPIVYYVVRYRRGVVEKNLRECFPELTPRERRGIERRFYRFMCDNAVETVKMAAMSPEEMERRMRFTNMEMLSRPLAEGRSVSLFLGHYGNWEWISSIPLHLRHDPQVTAGQIYHRLRNANFDRLLLGMRSRMGATNIEMRQTARYITRLLAEGRRCVIGFIADQSPRKREVRDFTDFLHHRTPVLTGPEKITKHYDFKAVYGQVRRTGRGYYEVTFVEMHPDPKSLPDFELTDIYYRMLEESIREHPEMYLWTHKRFKHATLTPNL